MSSWSLACEMLCVLRGPLIKSTLVDVGTLLLLLRRDRRHRLPRGTYGTLGFPHSCGKAGFPVEKRRDREFSTGFPHSAVGFAHSWSMVFARLGARARASWRTCAGANTLPPSAIGQNARNRAFCAVASAPQCHDTARKSAIFCRGTIIATIPAVRRSRSHGGLGTAFLACILGPCVFG